MSMKSIMGAMAISQELNFVMFQHEYRMGSDKSYQGWWSNLPAEERERYEKETRGYDEAVAKRAAEEEQEMLADRERRWESGLSAIGIPAKDVRRIVAKEMAETKAMASARQFLGSADKSILVLSGTKGCGKTCAASWALSEYSRETGSLSHIQRGSTGPSGGFMDVSKLARASRYDSRTMDPIEKLRLLVIDDLGMEFADVKGSFLATLDGIVNSRYAAELKTIITTNLPAEEFKERYGERIADRIRESGTFVELNEQSMRGRR